MDNSSLSCDSSRIVKERFEGELYDVMEGCSGWTIKLDEHGSVTLIDVMPRLVPVGKKADSAIPDAARTSYGKGTRVVTDDEGLIRYLKRHEHSTPEEMVELKFKIVAPIFVARQFVRHRTSMWLHLYI